MLRHDLKRMASTLAAAALLWSAAGTASAIGTDAGTVISNTATVVFTVNAVVQPAVASTAVDFMVDRRVDLTLTAVPLTYVTVTPNTSGAILFNLLNSSNASLNFALTGANNAVDPFGGVESFDPTTVTGFVDTGIIGTYEPLVDTATTVDTLIEDATVGVWLVGVIAAGETSGEIAAVTLTATARETTANGGGVLVQEAGADVTATMQTVFADGAGDTDVVRDRAFSDSGAFLVASADVTIAKTETLISDPINAVNPRHIPGAVVEYVVTVTNAVTSSLPATSLTISDVIPAGVTFAPDTYAVGSGIDLDGVPQTNVTGDDDAEFTAGTVTVTLPTLAPNTSTVITFRVTVN